MNDDTIFTGATPPLSDWASTRTKALADAYDDVLVAVLTEDLDELMAGRDYYARRSIVQDLTEAGHPDAVSADFAADRADEAEKIEAGRRGLAS